MKIKVEVDLEDFMDYWGDVDFDQLIAEELKDTVMNTIKRTKEYKAVKDMAVAKATESLLKQLEE